MKSIKEKELLVNFARSMGQEVDADLIEEIEVYNIIKSDVQKSIKENIFKDLANALKDDNAKPKVEPIQYPLPPSLDDLLTVLNEGIEKENNNELVQEKTETERASETPAPSFESDNRKIIEGNETPSNPTRDSGPQPGTQTLADLAAKFISEAPKDSFQQPDPLIVSDNLDAIRGKLKFLEQWVSKISSAGAGSGEVNFRWLDDVDRASIGNSEPVLRYNPVSKKFFFGTLVGDQGPIRSMTYDTRGYANITPTTGTTAWNSEIDCLEIYQADGTVLQTGLENYIRVYNNTGNLLTNGTFVQFSGAFTNNIDLATCIPYIADSTGDSLYSVGVLTNNTAPNTIGRATAFGEVHNLNTTGSDVGETWQVGNLLWAHPGSPGKLTRHQPTAPNSVVSVGAIMSVHESNGTILVRPTREYHKHYGIFSSNISQYANVASTPIAVTYNITSISTGISVVNASNIVFERTGLYTFKHSLQFTSTNAATKNIWVWARVNGVDVPLSTRKIAIAGNNYELVVTGNHDLTIRPNDKFQLMWAADDTAIIMNAPPAVSFAPSTPSVSMIVTEIAR